MRNSELDHSEHVPLRDYLDSKVDHLESLIHANANLAHQRFEDQDKAVLAALAALCIIAGVPSFLAELGHPLRPGPTLLFVVIGAMASATFVYLDIFRGHHKQSLMGRKAIGAAAGGAGGGGSKRNHHVRTTVATVGLAVFGLMVFINFSAVSQAVGGGF